MKGYVLKLLKVFVSLLIVYLVSLTLVYSVNINKLNERVNDGLNYIKLEGLYPRPFFGNKARVQLDNFTDRVMIDKLRPRAQDKNALYQVMDMNGYSRYWHGYAVVLRPLMAVFSYTTIRYIFLFLILGLFVYLCSMCAQDLGKNFAIAFFLGMFMIKITIIPVSLQFSNLMFVTLLGLAVYRFLYGDKEKYIDKNELGIFAFIIGSVTAFTDLLTTPILPFGVVLLFAMSWNKKYFAKVMALKEVAYVTLIWAVGYVATWASKWAIGSVVTQRNIVLNALNQVGHRMAGNGEGKAVFELHRLKMIGSQFGYLFAPSPEKLTIFIALLVMLLLIALYKNYPRREINKTYIGSLTFVALLPIAWYLMAANHSQIHCWFTYRSLAVTVMAFVLIVDELIDFGYLYEKINGRLQGFAVGMRNYISK